MKIKFKNLLLTMAVLLCSITSNADNAFTSSTSMGDFVFEGKCVEYLHDAGSWTLGYGCSWQSTNNNNIYTWKLPLVDDVRTNHIRLTVLETHPSESNYNGFPMVALGELKIYDRDGAKINYTVKNVSTNSLEKSEGSLEALCDNDYSTFYHSTWYSGTVPNDYVYLDINLPYAIDGFQIEMFSRNEKLMPMEVKVQAVELRNTTLVKYNGNDKNVQLPDDIFSYSIGNSVFENRTSIKNITIPECVTGIGENAFKGCTGLEKITIPNSVEGIGQFAFAGCTALTNATLSKNMRVPKGQLNGTGIATFYGCTNLTNITIPETYSYIADSTFYGCTKLADITIPDNIMEGIGSYAFYGCTSLVNLKLPDKITIIEPYAFCNCENLTYIDLPEILTYIGEYAFRGCNFANIRIPKHVSYLGDAAFWSCLNLKSVICETFNVSPSHSVFSSSIYNTATLYVTDYLQYYTNDAGWGRFGNIKMLDSKTDFCGDNVTWSIGSYGQLNISGVGAMYDYKKPSDVPWSSMINEIKYVYVNKGVTHIGANAFYGMNNVSYFSLPNTLTSIGGYAFAGSGIDEKFTIPQNVTSVGDYAFYNSRIEELTIPSNVQKIGALAFCISRLKTVTSKIPADRLFAVDYDALGSGNGSGITLNVPYGAASKYKTKDGWSKLTNINEYIEHCGNNATWTFDETTGRLTISGSGAIYDYTNNYDAPWYHIMNKIQTVVVEEGITKLGRNAFNGCSKLKYFVSRISADNLLGVNEQDSIFYGVDKSSCILYVPVGTKSKYSVSTGWKQFSSIRERDNTDGLFCGDNATYAFDETTGTLTISGHGEMYDFPVGLDVVPWYSYSDKIKTIVIGNNITKIGANAFVHLVNLTKVAIPESVTKIGRNAFFLCTSLSEIVIPGSVTYIGSCSFYGCSALTSITSEISANNLFAIYNDVFEGVNKSNCTLSVPAGAKSIYAATDGWKQFTKIKEIGVTNNYCGDNATWSFNESTGILTISGSGAIYDYDDGTTSPWRSIKDKIKTIVIGNNITKIGVNAFCDFVNLTKVTIGSGVKSINFGAFYGATSLKTIVIPNNVVTIEQYAFRYCTALENVTLSKNLTATGVATFEYCSNLRKLTLPEGIKTIDNWTFASCPNLENIEIPNSVTSIGDYAFYNCTSLAEIVIPSGVKYIGMCAFLDCSGLENVTSYIPAGNLCAAGSEGYSAFFDVENCTLYVPDGAVSKYSVTFGWKLFSDIQVIGKPNNLCGDNATWEFDETTGTLTISGSGAMYDYDMFYEESGRKTTPWFSLRRKIKTVNVESGITKIGDYAFAHCGNLANVIISEGVTNIGECAFLNCQGFYDIKLPNSVTSIEYRAFWNCYWLKTINIPANVTSIGSYAFNYCDNFESIFSEIPAEKLSPVAEDAFEGVSWVTLYVPVGAKATYNRTTGWRNLSNIVEYDPTGVEDIEEDVVAFDVTTGGIRFTAAAGKPVAVYAVNGALVEKIDCYAGEEIMLDKGIYVVRVGEKIIKIKL